MMRFEIYTADNELYADARSISQARKLVEKAKAKGVKLKDIMVYTGPADDCFDYRKTLTTDFQDTGY